MTGAPDKLVSCNRRQPVSQIINSIVNEIENLISSSADWPEEQKERCQQFKEVFSTAVQENLQINQQSWQERVEKSESKSMSLENEKKVNEVLLPQVNDVLVITTKKRKLLPSQCAQYSKRRFRQQYQQLDNLKIPIKEEKTLIISPNKQYEERLGQSMKDIASLTKTIPDLVEKTHGMMSIQMQQRISSNVDLALFEDHTFSNQDSIRAYQPKICKKSSLLFNSILKS